MSTAAAILSAIGAFLCGIQIKASKGHTRLWWIAGAVVLGGLNVAIQEWAK